MHLNHLSREFPSLHVICAQIPPADFTLLTQYAVHLRDSFAKCLIASDTIFFFHA
jgi:hypothetical protein